MIGNESQFREARREFGEFVDWLMDALSNLSAAEQIFALCSFCLVMMWLMVRRSGEYENEQGMGRQFNMALLLVVIFGLGIGSFFGPGLDALSRIMA